MSQRGDGVLIQRVDRINHQARMSPRLVVTLHVGHVFPVGIAPARDVLSNRLTVVYGLQECAKYGA
jgi:hypothetical protein